jgi:hypothetical protein
MDSGVVLVPTDRARRTLTSFSAEWRFARQFARLTVRSGPSGSGGAKVLWFDPRTCRDGMTHGADLQGEALRPDRQRRKRWTRWRDIWRHERAGSGHDGRKVQRTCG